MKIRVFILASLAATLVSSAPAAGEISPPAPPASSSTACHAPDWRATRRAIEAWCESRAPIERRYYNWSIARTKRRACADLRTALAHCEDIRRDMSLDGEDGRYVVVPYPAAEVTYWQVSFTGEAPNLRVATVDFYEDCTGP